MAERNATGQFEKGHTTSQGKRAAGGGRKPDSVRRALHDLMDEAITDADWIAIFRAQLDQAKMGDVRSAQFLSDRKFGKPKDQVEITDTRENVAPTSVVFNAPAVIVPECPNSSNS